MSPQPLQMKQLSVPHPQALWHGDAGAQYSMQPSGMAGSSRRRRAALATRGAPETAAIGMVANMASLDTRVHRSTNRGTCRANMVILAASSREPFAHELAAGASTTGFLDDDVRFSECAGDSLGGHPPLGVDDEEMRSDERFETSCDRGPLLEDHDEVVAPNGLLPCGGMVCGQTLADHDWWREGPRSKLRDQLGKERLARWTARMGEEHQVLAPRPVGGHEAASGEGW